MKLRHLATTALVLGALVFTGTPCAKPVQLNASGVTDLDQPGGLLDDFFGLANLAALEADQPLRFDSTDSISAFSLTAWPGFIRGFGIIDADGGFASILDKHTGYQSGPVDLGHLDAPFGFGLDSQPIPASSALVPGDDYAQTTLQAWQVTAGAYSGSYLFTWENVVGGGPRNHHDLAILVSGVQLVGPDVHPVPVPAALWLLGSGLLGLFGLLRCRA
jgi:hypothetical protein